MDASIVRTALGTLQRNPDSAEAIAELEAGLAQGSGDSDVREALDLLQAARERHAERGEAQAVLRLLEHSLALARGTADEGALASERAGVLLADLFEGKRALVALEEASQAAGSDADVLAALEDARTRAENWQEQADSYRAEAESATDDAYRSAMLMRASEAEACFADEPRYAKIIEDLELALRLDPANLPASRLCEVIYRRLGDHAGLERVLERAADRAPDLAARIAAGIRLARHFEHQKGDLEHAAQVFDRVLDSDPKQPDALEFVTDYYAANEKWDALVRVYERGLKAGPLGQDRVGDMLQVAMLHWKMRGELAEAAIWFERIRLLEPAHDGVLAFFREYKLSLSDDAGLAEILREALSALPAGDPRAPELTAEISRHVETQAGAHRQIEHYKAILRESPDEQSARDALKTLYKQTQGHNALIELLRQELDRTPEADIPRRLVIMREIAGVYREYVKSDTALVGMLNQIVQLDGKLDEHDVGEVRELVALYERLARPRDLLASQKLLAEIVTDVEEKKSLYRQVGRRWLEQYSNVQHALEAFAALYALDPTDPEAGERLEDLYRKRRAWKELYDLYEHQLGTKEGDAQVPILREMAQLASDRLSQPEKALEFYQAILRIDPTRAEILDRLEKHAERARNWAALADVLERRLPLATTDEARLVILQKLGAVYSDQLEQEDQAIATWRRVVEVSPGNQRAMRVLRDTYIKLGRFDELEELYVRQNDLEGLAEVLSTAADRAREPATKIDLSYRAARVFEQRLGQSARAVRSYERILGIEPHDARAVERLLSLYEADEKWARIPSLLESQLQGDGPGDKIAIVEKLVEVSLHRLLDRRAALGYALRGYALAPRDPRTLSILDSASRAAGSFQEMVDALGARAESLDPGAQLSSAETPAPVEVAAPPAASGGKRKKGKRGGSARASETPPPVETTTAAPATVEPLGPEIRAELRDIGLRRARVLGEELGRIEEAIAVCKELLASGGDPEARALLESLLRRESRPSEVRWLYVHREAAEADATRRAAVRTEFASFEESQGDAARALELYQKALDDVPDERSALDAVVRLALAADDTALAASTVEKQRDLLDGVERGEKEARLAGLYATLSRSEDALVSVKRALDAGVEPGLVIPVLQRLVEVPQVRAEAARLLSEQYEAGGDARREADAVVALISETSEPERRVELFQRLATIYLDKLAEPAGALVVLLDAVVAHPGELELWDRASELAGAAGRTQDLAAAYKRALASDLDREVMLEVARRGAELHESVLMDGPGAIPYFQKLLELEPEDDHAFGRLKAIFTEGERWRDLEQLYDVEIKRVTDDARRIELLAEVALVAEDIVGSSEKAASYHERIRELDPDFDVSLAALDRLYVRLGRTSDLLDLLDRRAELAAGDQQLGLLVRLGRGALDAGEAKRSVEAIVRVLDEEPGHFEAREIAEKLLALPESRAAAAAVLERVYETRDEIRDLVRILGVRVELLRVKDGETLAERELTEREDERRDLLRRIATLRDDRLHDDEGSFDVFAELVPLDPVDSDLRSRLIESGHRLGRDKEVAEVLDSAAAATQEMAIRSEILLQLAKLEQSELGDAARAEATYLRVVGLSSEEPEAALEALRAVEMILMRAGRSADLAKNLREQVELEHEPDVRAELLARIAQLSSEVLGDVPAAIAAWETRQRDDEGDVEALVALSALYEQAGRYQDLASVLAARRDAAADAVDRMAVARHLADVQERHLGDLAGAIESYEAIASEGGTTVEVLLALGRLFAATERHQDLADVLEKQCDVLTEPNERMRALVELGRLRVKELADVSGALVVYRQGLELDAGNASVRLALRELLAHDDPVTRLEAAEILRPVVQVSDAPEELLQVLDVQVAASDDPALSLDALDAATRVAEERLGDPGRAFDYAARGIALAAGQVSIDPWFHALERLAGRASRRKQQVEVLTGVVESLFEVEQQLLVQRRIAEIQEKDLNDVEQAIAAYEKCLEIAPGDRDALGALERLHRSRGDHEALLGVLERQAEGADSGEMERSLAFRRAELLTGDMDDPERAIGVYESIIEQELDPRASDALVKLYTKTERFGDLVTLYERHVDSGKDMAAYRVRLAEALALRVGDYDRAIDELESALAEEAAYPAAVALLERLLSLEATPVPVRARVALVLEPIYMVRSSYERVLDMLEVRIAASDDPSTTRDLILRAAQVHEEQREDYRAALEAVGRLLAEDPADEQITDELERLSKVIGSEERLGELYEARVLAASEDDDATIRLAKRAGRILRDAGKDERALVLLRRALAFEPDSVELFQDVDELLVEKAAVDDRIALHQAAVEHRYDPADQVALLHVIAKLEEGRGDADAATIAHERAVELDDANVTSLDALTHLYAAAERYSDLATLYESRADRLGADEGARYRLALAALLVNRLGRPGDALDQLEIVVRDAKDKREAAERIEAFRAHETLRERAVEILLPFYSAEDDWRRLVTLGRDRFELASDPNEKADILREVAELWERRGGDAEKALEVMSEALELVPDDESVRSEVERLVASTKSHKAQSALYRGILKKNPDLDSKREYLARLAELADTRLDDPRQALADYVELFALEPDEVATALAMERLSTLLGDWPVLGRALRARADASYDPSEQVDLLIELGDLQAHSLDDLEEARATYEQALSIDERSARALDRLLPIYRAKKDGARLVDLLAARVECEGITDDLRYELEREAARTFEQDLEDRPRAIERLGQALFVRPGDASTIDELNRLYRLEGEWSELLDNLRLEAGTAEEPERRLAIRSEIGQILADKLESYEEAISAYGIILEERPDHGPTLDAVFAIANREEHLRSVASDLLFTALRQTSLRQRLVDAVELRLSVEQDPAVRVENLRLVATELERLGNVKGALDALVRATADAPEQLDLYDALLRLSEGKKANELVLGVLEERAADLFEPPVAAEVWVRAATVAEERLSDLGRAVNAYEKATEQVGDRLDLLDALDRLYSALDQTDKVVELLERRMALADSEEARSRILTRQARLQLDKQKAPADAVSSLSQALVHDLHNEEASEVLESLLGDKKLFDEVFGILDGVYRDRKSAARLATLHQRRLAGAKTDEERLELRRELASVLENECSDVLEAQRVLAAGLANHIADESLFDDVQRLAGITGAWGELADQLTLAVMTATEQAGSKVEPEVLAGRAAEAARWFRDRASDPEGAERALGVALSITPDDDLLLEQLEALQSVGGREKELLVTVLRRVDVASDDASKLDLLRRAKELADIAGDAAASEAALRSILDVDGGDPWALEALTAVCRAKGDHAETYELLLRRVEVETDQDTVLVLRADAAALARDHLGKLAEATTLLEQLHEQAPSDEKIATELGAAYEAAERYADLARLLEERVERADDARTRADFRVRLASVFYEHLEDTEAAVSLLERTFEEAPDFAAGAAALEELYVKEKQSEALATLYERQAAHARERGEGSVVVERLRKLAKLAEGELGDTGRALEAWTGLQRVEETVEVLEALLRVRIARAERAEAAELLETLSGKLSGEAAVLRKFELGALYVSLGQPGRAKVAYDAIITLAPAVADGTDAAGRKRLDAAFLEIGAFDRIAALLVADAERAEGQARVDLLRQAATIVAEKAGDPARAAELLERASKERPDDRALLLDLCDAYSAAGRAEEAIVTLEKVVESFGGKRAKELGEIHRRLAGAFVAKGDRARALEELDKAFRIEPGNIAILKQLGDLALESGDFKKADQMFRALLLQRLDDKSPITKAQVFCRLGDLQRAQGEPQKAKQFYERALATDKDLEEAKAGLAAC